MTTDARTDWETRIGIRSGTLDATFAGSAPQLPPPAGLVAEGGGHQVTLVWHPVPGAIGYQVHVAESADGPFEPLDHHGRDVTSVAAPAVRRHDRRAGRRAVVRRVLAVRRARRGPALGTGVGDPAGRGGPGGRCRSTRRRSSATCHARGG